MMTLGAGSVLSLWVLGIKLRLSGVCVSSVFTMKSPRHPTTKFLVVQIAYHCVCEHGGRHTPYNGKADEQG